MCLKLFVFHFHVIRIILSFYNQTFQVFSSHLPLPNLLGSNEYGEDEAGIFIIWENFLNEMSDKKVVWEEGH